MGSFDLPKTIPIFPLSGALLLPDGRLPLNIFEPRYISMIDAILAGKRFLGMVQPRVSSSQSGGDISPVYDIGCLGRLSTFSQLDDGRYSIILSGFSRFKIVEEITTLDPWRSVVVDYSPFAEDLKRNKEIQFVREPFIEALQAYFATYSISGSWEAIEKADEATLIASVAMAVPLSPQEKQAILECVSIVDQGKILQSMMEMAVYEINGNETDVTH